MNKKYEYIQGDDLRPRPRRIEDDYFYIPKENIEIPLYLSTPSPEMAEKIAKAKERMEYLKETTLNERPEFFHDLQKISIDIIHDVPEGWNLFSDPTEEEILDLMRSIESVGLLNPIYVIQNSDGEYIMLIGRFRHMAYLNLYEITGLEKYKYIPAYVIQEDEVDELYLRNMVFESNFKFRNISKFNLIKTLIQNYEVMRRTKKYRNEKNVAMELSKQFEISETSVFNYLRVRSLCDSGLHFLYTGRIKLKAALYLTRVSKNLQEDILEHFGVESVNAIFRLKLLTAKDNIKLEELKKQINVVNNLTPEKTRITLEVHRTLLNSLIDLLLAFKRAEAAEYAGKATIGKFSNVFNIKCNKEDMGFYLEKGVINEVSLNKLLAVSIQEMAKVK